LSQEGAAVTLFARSRTRVEARDQALECQWETWDRAKQFKGQLLINATPVGMHPGPEESPIPWEGIRTEVACDLVYNPVSTRFLQEGARRGAKTVSGIHMFLAQALLQFEILTGAPAPRSLFEEILGPRLQGAVPAIP
jgi:shikimate 5-dehydrogenase